MGKVLQQSLAGMMLAVCISFMAFIRGANAEPLDEMAAKKANASDDSFVEMMARHYMAQLSVARHSPNIDAATLNKLATLVNHYASKLSPPTRERLLKSVQQRDAMLPKAPMPVTTTMHQVKVENHTMPIQQAVIRIETKRQLRLETMQRVNFDLGGKIIMIMPGLPSQPSVTTNRPMGYAI